MIAENDNYKVEFLKRDSDSVTWKVTYKLTGESYYENTPISKNQQAKDILAWVIKVNEDYEE